MTDSIPKSKMDRTISTGKIAVKMGTKQLGFMLKKTFLSKAEQKKSKDKKDKESAKILFNGLSMLRGTALKAAQMLSFENDLLPDGFKEELEKSYNQVPPINRALARKIVTNNFNAPPESVFGSFDSHAFAAASLGQVHLATSNQGDHLAVKIQYPDISQTIANDIRLLKTLLRPMTEYELIEIALEEIKDVLLAETDYEKEGQNILFFKTRLKHPRVIIPELHQDLTTKNVLSMSRLPGKPLNEWLKTKPDQDSKQKVAQILHDIFVHSFYQLKQIHADPNPGNFLITNDLKVGLVDFGCIRAFDDTFIHLYQSLIRIGSSNDKDTHKDLLIRLQFITPDQDPDITDQLIELFMQIGDWLSQLYRDEYFDFSANPDFMNQGKKIGKKMQHFRKHIHHINPEFIFLDRTRYGLLKLFEKMKVKINIRNEYENGEHI